MILGPYMNLWLLRSGTISRAKSTAKTIRLKPWPTTTPEGRSKERYRRAFLSTITSVMARCASSVMLLVSVPLTIHYLGAERYGIWMTITSTVALLNFADFGIGSGLMNILAEAVAKGDHKSARSAISNAICLLSGIAILIVLIACAVYPFVNWASIFNVHSPVAARESGPALMVVLGAFALNLPLGVVARVENGLQNGFVQNLWGTAGTLLSLTGLLVAIAIRADLPTLVLLVLGGPISALAANGLRLVITKPWVRPSLRLCAYRPMHQLLGTGMMFFVIQVSISIAYQADNVVIAHILGARMVTYYAVPARMFTIITIMMSVIMSPLWPAYTEAIAVGDCGWIRRTFLRSCAISLAIALPFVLALVLFGNIILRYWVGPQVQASIPLLAFFGARCLMSAVFYPVSILLNGVGEMKFQAKAAFAMSVANIIISVLLVKRYGIVGAIAGTVIAETIFSAIPCIYIVRRVLKNLEIPAIGSGARMQDVSRL